MNKNIFLRNLLIFFMIFFIICIILFFTMFYNDNQNEKLSSKTEKEIEYLEEKIIGIMNSLNNISFSNSRLVEERTENRNQNSESNQNTEQSNGGSSKSQESSTSTQSSSQSNSSGSNNQQSNTKVDTKFEIVNDSILLKEDENIDWEHIKSSVESIHSTWATLTVDLHSLNVKSEDILNFGSVLDQVTISANNEDKTATLNNLASLYAFFPNYITQISNDNEKINIDLVKTCILNSYALLEQNKWDEMKAQITTSINYFSSVLNSVNENNQNQSKITKIYVMLNELNNSIDLKDKDLYMIKYKNVMDELVNFNYTNKA